MLLRHTTEKIEERSALTINPAKTCQPVGAMYCGSGYSLMPPAQSWLTGMLFVPPQRTYKAL